MRNYIASSFAVFISFIVTCSKSAQGSDLLVVTIATDHADGLQRFLQSAKYYGIEVKVFGLGTKWDGGDVARYAGGGHKVNILKEKLEEYKDSGRVIMFTDSYDVVFTDGPKNILEKFSKFGANVVFSAEGFCWPDDSLAAQYPEVTVNEKRFLNSGGFMGYAKDIYEVISHHEIENRADDQLYYTNIFLDKKLRNKWNMRLDNRGDIFQPLNGALDEVMIKFKGSTSYLYNTKTGNIPIVIHGNGPIKTEFNRLANYLSDGWAPTTGCQSCQRDVIDLDKVKLSDYPTVFLGIFIEQPTPFIKEFFWSIGNLTYPKEKIDVFIHNNEKYHIKDVELFLDHHIQSYHSFHVIEPEQSLPEGNARNKALEDCIKKNCQYYFSVDSIGHLTNSDIIQILIEQNRTVIAPLLMRPGKLWSNFWGSLSPDGFYARSDDYVDIVEGEKIGLWNIPYMSSSYLIHGYKIPDILGSYISGMLDADMALCKALRNKGIFMFVSNVENFGHLIDADNFITDHPHGEMYEIFENSYNWEQRYIHPNYSQSLAEGAVNLQPCPDVYWFPVVTPEYCWHLIDIMEHFGEWSGGKNEDKRLAGGYENVPTVDIHMNQVGMERHWLYFLKKYILPLQQKEFIGYYHDPPEAIMNFVVRYKPAEQPLLRPHHDASTFTLNMALNRPGIDFQGGGTRFIRYNCSLTNARQGWGLISPGRLTHYHEGLRTTSGTRYIMISFVDP